VPITRRKSDDELPERLRHDADAGPVVMPHYTVLNRKDWERLEQLIESAMDERDGKIAWERRNDPITATWEEVREKYGL
jgi:hypothetical protein